MGGDAVKGARDSAAGVGVYDPFAVLGIARGYEVSAEEVARARRRLLLALHPDRISDVIQREMAIRQAAAVNAAATMLLDPEERAEVLLGLLDPTSGAVPLPAAALAELLERREEVDSAMGDPQRIASLRSGIHADRSAHRAALSKAFGSTDPDCRAARVALAWLRALVRLEESIERSAAGRGKS